MAAKKQKRILRIPKDSVLEEYGISRSSTAALMRKVGEANITYNDEIMPHNAVIKMNDSIFEHEKRNAEQDYTLNGLDIRVAAKLGELKLSKYKYDNNKIKLAHEIELEKLRNNNKKKRRFSLSGISEDDENKKARQLYDSNIVGVSVKTTSSVKNKIKKSADDTQNSELQLSDEIKKLRISMTTNSKGTKTQSVENLMKNADFRDPASQFFARKLGWIEDNTRRIPLEIESPLYQYEKELINDEELNIKDGKTTSNVNHNESTITEAESDFSPEMDLMEIQRLERKYKKEADEIRRQIEKNNISSKKTVENISTVYGKLLGKNRTGIKKDIQVSNKAIDVSKIPSFVLDEKKYFEKPKK